MPRFKVELEKRLFRPGELNRNPFLASIPGPGRTVDMSIRSWEFEAADEKEVRKLLAEAQEQRIGNVRGYRLRSIVQLPKGKPCTCDNCLGSSRACGVDAGEQLGELWYCRKQAERDHSSAPHSQVKP